MNRPLIVISLGILLGIVGAIGQIWLFKFGVVESAPLRNMLSTGIAVTIGIIAGLTSRRDSIKAAILMGVNSGVILAIAGLCPILLDPSLIGQNPLFSVERLLIFMSSVITGTVIIAWVFAGIAALVAWPISLSQNQQSDK